jgi:predicted anti-sigma-YlaC factor YlaD
MRRLQNRIPTRGHPGTLVLSRYLEDDLQAATYRRIEAHLRDCARCRRVLASLAETVQALGSIRETAPAALADSIVAAVQAEPAPDPRSSTNWDWSGRRAQAAGLRGPSSGRVQTGLRAGLQYCLSRSRLRLTLPITIVAGVALSMANMGGMLIHGKIDLSVCLMCATNFLVPFAALNLALLLLMWPPTRRGAGPRGRSSA